MPILRPVGPVPSAQGKALGMVLECSSALKGPFTALFAVRRRHGCCLNGPFQGRIVGGHGTQGFADFALGWWNEPFRLKDGLIRDTTGIANSATSKSASKGLRFPRSSTAWSFAWVPLACASGVRCGKVVLVPWVRDPSWRAVGPPGSSRRAGCGNSACPVRRAGSGNGVIDKEGGGGRETRRDYLRGRSTGTQVLPEDRLPRHSSTLLAR